jgi:murein L,D-transpeptidase YcbB/YkuD
MLSYSAIEVRGGWPGRQGQPRAGAKGADVASSVSASRHRGPAGRSRAGDAYDTMLTEAVKRFQVRHGLPETGTVGPQTIEALNVPVQAASASSRLARPAQRHDFTSASATWW